jgi:hypothetical protein
MAESTSVALPAAPIPSSAEISRAEKLVRERFLHEGEDPAVALAPGSPRRRALDEALAELARDPKTKHPSTAWRRQFSLLLGLERLLSEDEPELADGTQLSSHQVDALSGTLTALLAEAQRSAPGRNGRAAASPELLATADILGPEDLIQTDDSDSPAPAPDGSAEAAEEPEGEEPEEEEEDDEEDDELEPIQRAAPDEEGDEDEDEDEDEDLDEEEEEEDSR